MAKHTLIAAAVIAVVTGSLSFKKSRQTHPYPFALPAYFPAMPGTGGNVTVEGAELGRYLFYDRILSRDGTVSCNSCHSQEAAFSDAPRVVSTGINGVLQTRNTPPLFNLAWHPHLSWDGSAAGIEAQVLRPVRHHDEMNLQWQQAAARIANSAFYAPKFREVFGAQRIDSTLIAGVIGQFLRTLISCNSKYDSVLQGKATFTSDEAEGFVLVNDMTKGDCLHCHTTDSDPLGTTLGFSNNGLDTFTDAQQYKDKGRGTVTGNAADNGLFKIPSLRNVALTAPYMHDGRFGTLEEVINFYSEGVNACANVDSKMEFAHQHGAHLSAKEKQQILAFLRTLTDYKFVRDEKFSDPFLQQQRAE